MQSGENPKLKIEYLPISELKPYKRNAKIHTVEQIDQIAKSIQEFGFNDPIAISNGIIVEGHGRLLAAQKLEYKELPIIRLDSLTDEKRRAYTLIHNQITLNSDFDIDILNSELEDLTSLDDFNIDFEDFGFSFDDIDDEIREKQERHEKSIEDTEFIAANYLNLGYAQFEGVGEYDIPEILPVYELPEIKEWIGFNYVLTDNGPEGKAVHFFLDDYQFERLWNSPTKYIDKLKRYVCVCSPDFSPMPDMPWAVQVFNHYRKHWVGRWLQENGVTVIPTIRASADEKSFKYCFDGEPKNSIVMYSAQWTKQKEARESSQKEYDEMLKRLDPKKIFVYQYSNNEHIDFRGKNIEIVKSFRHKNWR